MHSITYTDHSSLALLSFCGYLTGAGSSAGLSAGLNSVAKVRALLSLLLEKMLKFMVYLQSFPDSTRATATGIVLAGYGLSAL